MSIFRLPLINKPPERKLRRSQPDARESAQISRECTNRRDNAVGSQDGAIAITTEKYGTPNRARIACRGSESEHNGSAGRGVADDPFRVGTRLGGCDSERRIRRPLYSSHTATITSRADVTDEEGDSAASHRAEHPVVDIRIRAISDTRSPGQDLRLRPGSLLKHLYIYILAGD